MNTMVYNYHVVRFLPYPETGEFVNIGVILFCPQIGFFDFMLETHKSKRATDFFPELERHLLQAALASFTAEADHFKKLFRQDGTRVFRFEVGFGMEYYATFTRPREGLIRFSNPRTGMVAAGVTPEQVLGKLFADNVQRQFAQDKEYHERQMQKRLQQDLVRAALYTYYKPGKIGNDDYHVGFPFIYSRNDKPVKAMKPLNLNKSDSTDIYNHGGEWQLRLARLHKFGLAPEQLILAVDCPADTEGRRATAANEVCQMLREIPNLRLIDFNATDEIINAARVG
jgi:hypothetical protein